jgi:hypothetical protein
MSAITAILFAHPHPAFFQLSLQTKHLFNSTLGRPLGDACVTLGRPLGDPWVTQGSPNPNPKQAEGRNPRNTKRNGISVAKPKDRRAAYNFAALPTVIVSDRH